MSWVLPVHGGEVQQAANRAGLKPQAFLDASASLVPWTPRMWLLGCSVFRDYPDRSQMLLRQHIAACMALSSLRSCQATALTTWAARDAAEQGLSAASTGFRRLRRALRWTATMREQRTPLFGRQHSRKRS